MARKAWAALALLAAAFTAPAAAPGGGFREPIEASMLLTGTIEIDPAGAVTAFGIDDREKVPPHVDALVARTVPGWRFEPTLVDGVAASVRTPMRVRVVATQVPDDPDALEVRVAGASFGGEEGPESLHSARLAPPDYPRIALDRGAAGTVYVIVKVGRDGRVEDAVAEQVNLRFRGSARELQRMRDRFAASAIRATERWSFVPPSQGPAADAPYWLARVPVEYAFEGDQAPGYGEWAVYIPGPRQVVPWIDPADHPGGDAYVAGGAYMVGSGPKLLTELGAGR